MANLKPWYNMFPHANYGIFNLDFLLQKYGEQDERIKKVEEKNDEQDTRLDADEADIAQLLDDMSQAKDDIDALEGRMDTAEGDIDALEGRMDTAEGDIDALEGRMDTAEGDIDALQSAVGDSTTGLVKDVSDLKQDVSDIKQDIIDIGLKDQAQDNAIDGLDSRVTDLENEAAVIANPGGTGPLLNTVSISGTTYTIDNSGGGGGGGSSVTPNPAGTPTQTLDKVDIDGTIYGIPVTAADKTAIEGDISDLQSDVSDIDNTVDVINTWIAGDDSPIAPGHFNMEATGSVQTLDDTLFTINTPGLYLINAHTEINTTNYGSSPRYLGFYTRVVGGHDNGGDPWGSFNLQLDKFSIRGDEPAMITQAASMSNVTLLNVISGEEYQIKLAVRCNAANNQRFSGDYWFDCIRLK